MVCGVKPLMSESQNNHPFTDSRSSAILPEVKTTQKTTNSSLISVFSETGAKTLCYNWRV